MIFNEKTGGGGSVLEPLSVNQNGTYTPPAGVDGYSQVSVSVAAGGGGNINDDVRFFDYDGSCVASYSAADFAALTALPANPSHTGLTAQGWNWTLTDAKTYVAACGMLDIGQQYVTDDGKTRVYIHLDTGRLKPALGLALNGTATVEWGDGQTSTLTGNSLSTIVTEQHNYGLAGDYIIKISVSGDMALQGEANKGSKLITSGGNSTTNRERAYLCSVKKIEIGNHCAINDYAFESLSCLECITLPSGLGSFGKRAFSSTPQLKCITIPSGQTSIKEYAFSMCSGLEFVSIPDSVVSMETYIFSNCKSLKRVSIPSQVSTIATYLFNECPVLEKVSLPASVTLIDSYAFYSCRLLKDIGTNFSTTVISRSSFVNCEALSQFVIPNGATEIGLSAFRACTALKSITIPSTVTTLVSSAFQYCYALSSITIPSGVTSIGPSAFVDCFGLGEVHFKPTIPPTQNDPVWTNLPTDCKIYVPQGCLSAYTSASNYPSSSTYTYIEE